MTGVDHRSVADGLAQVITTHDWRAPYLDGALAPRVQP